MRTRRTIKILFLILAGIILGCIAYQAIMFVRISRLRSQNPTSTSLMLARVSEAQAKGQLAPYQQTWMPLDRISASLQRAVLAGEDTNFATHHGFDYDAIQKAWERAQQEAKGAQDHQPVRRPTAPRQLGGEHSTQAGQIHQSDEGEGRQQRMLGGGVKQTHPSAAIGPYGARSRAGQTLFAGMVRPPPPRRFLKVTFHYLIGASPPPRRRGKM